ncbi:MAG: lpg1661 family Dot/Icm T4SS effector [Acidobacteriaceae bacterium]
MFSAAIKPARVISVDVLRGLTIALMILVNDPGDGTHTYTQLEHAAWNGFTLTDFVFPNFLFLVGVSIVLSLQSRLSGVPGRTPDTRNRRALALRIGRRAALLFAVKMFLTAFPHFHMTHLRIFGVLTRIAVCYLVAALVCLYSQRVRTLLTVIVSLLFGYWIVMRFVPVPGLGIPVRDFPILDPNLNLAAWLDRGFNAFTRRWLHTGVLYNGTRDPEGILSTLPSIATTLIGAVAEILLRRGRRLLTLVVGGLVSLVSGLFWDRWFPTNKNLWTSSYVLFAAGLSLLLLSFCYWLFEVRHVHETRLGGVLTRPWLIFGSNAITAFVISNLVVEILASIHFANAADSRRPLTAWNWPYRHIFAVHGSTNATSLAFALTYTAICFLPCWLLWRKRIFLKL